MNVIFSAKKTKAQMIEGMGMDKATAKAARMVKSNTLQYIAKDRIFVKFHNTIIIEIDTKKKSMKLDSGGWRTPTTKDRMNTYIAKLFRPGIYISQRAGQWFVTDEAGQSLTFFDGIVIGGKKEYQKAKKEGVKENKKAVGILKLIDKYVETLKKIASTKGIPVPNRGDCWYCFMQEVKTGKPLGDVAENNDHLLSHLKDKYVMGSLVINAFKEVGYGPYVYGGYFEGGIGLNDKKDTKTLVRVVRRYFKRHLGIAQ